MPLTKDDLKASKIWSNALRDGELVFAMDQTKTPAHETPGPWGHASAADGGYCMGLVMHWLACRREGKDFDYDKTTHLFSNPHWHATKYQNIYMVLPTSNVKATSGDMVQQDRRDSIRAAGMVVKGVSAELQMNADNWRTMLAGQKKNSLCYVTLFGHAVAAQTIGTSPRFFDPNFGHFRFSNFSRFKDWMKFFLTESRYDQSYTKMKALFVE